MQAFVLNLDSRPDRWALIKKRMPEFKLRRISAIVKPVGGYGNFLSIIDNGAPSFKSESF